MLPVKADISIHHRPFSYGDKWAGWIREEPVPRLNDDLLHCTVYVYPSKQAAYRGECAGGSGFLVEVLGEERPFYYVVTNHHVIRDEYSANKASGVRLTGIKTEIDRTQIATFLVSYIPVVESVKAEHWVVDKGNDLAVCEIDLSMATHHFKVIPSTQFMDFATMATRMIGIGDEVFMVGRFVTREGRQKNTPTARFGCIAQMSDEPISYGDYSHEAFLVECRSIGGFSGSPVFVYLPHGDFRRRTIQEDPSENGPWLLGVECCFFPDWDWIYRVKDGKKSQKWAYNRNAGLSGVIPAWKLSELLNSPILAKKRQVEDAEEKRRKEFRNRAIPT